MKKNHSSHPTAFAIVLKSIAVVFNSFFQSANNREFKRLKNFIAS
jgi:hypothetical protein